MSPGRFSFKKKKSRKKKLLFLSFFSIIIISIAFCDSRSRSKFKFCGYYIFTSKKTIRATLPSHRLESLSKQVEVDRHVWFRQRKNSHVTTENSLMLRIHRKQDRQPCEVVRSQVFWTSSCVFSDFQKLLVVKHALYRTIMVKSQLAFVLSFFPDSFSQLRESILGIHRFFCALMQRR
jgi:hypothetical protein